MPTRRLAAALSAIFLICFGIADAHAACQPGTVESRYTAGRCYPEGADDCGRLGQVGYCLPGTYCSEGEVCISASDHLTTVSCAKYNRPKERCPKIGWNCHPKSGCFPIGATPCEEFGYCERGFRCAKKPGECLRIGAGVGCAAVGRPDESCPPGWVCNPKASGCIQAGHTPCGKASCPAGTVCIAGDRCMRP